MSKSMDETDGSLMIAGDFWILRKLVITKNKRGPSPWRSWHNAREFDFLMGTYYMELLASAFQRASPQDNSYLIHGPTGALKGPKGLFNENHKQPYAIQRQHYGEVKRTRSDADKSLTWRAVETFDFDVQHPIENMPARENRQLKPTVLLLDASTIYLHERPPFNNGSLKSWEQLAVDYLQIPKHSNGRWLICKFKDRQALESTTDATSRGEHCNLCTVLSEAVGQHEDHCIVFVASEDLRASGKAISYEVSWERTLQSTIEIINGLSKEEAPPYPFLKNAQRIIVGFVPDGLIYVRRSGPAGRVQSAHLFFDPTGIEHHMRHSTKGFVNGGDTIVVTAVAHYLAALPAIHRQETETIEEAITTALAKGLKAARMGQVHGLVAVRRCIELPADEGRDAWFVAPEDVRATCCSTAIKFYKDHCKPLMQLFDRRADPHDIVPMMPVDLLADIVVTGECSRFQWFGREKPSQLTDDEQTRIEKFQRERRAMHAEVQSSWRECGWVYDHFFDLSVETGAEGPLHRLKNELSGIKSQGMEDFTKYERAWFTSLDNFIYTVNTSWRKDVSREGYKETATRLARYVLQYGPEAILNSKSRSDLVQEVRANLNIEGEVGPRNVAHYWSSFPVIEFGGNYLFTRQEIESARGLERILRDYMLAARNQKRKPLSVAVLGPAGSGKSSFVTSILRDLSRHKLNSIVLEYNLSQIASKHDLEKSFIEIVNAGASGDTPVVFWDEYDSQHDKPFGWLESFLMPMNDGKFLFNGNGQLLPNCVFIFAGSLISDSAALRKLADGEDLPSQLDSSRHFKDAKGRDFLSRLSFCVDICGVNPPEGDDDSFQPSRKPDSDGYRFRRAMIIRKVLADRYPQLFDDDRLNISNPVADLLLGSETKYTHEARSIERIIGMCALANKNQFDASCLPTGSQIDLHTKRGIFELD